MVQISSITVPNMVDFELMCLYCYDCKHEHTMNFAFSAVN